MTRPLDHRESSDLYQGELFWDAKVRVAVCRDGIQWLLQLQTGVESTAGPRWRSIGYCTTRKALSRLSQAQRGKSDPRIDTLPERITRRAA